MIELRFHQDLYDGFAVDEAAKVYGAYGALELVRDAEAWVVRVTAGADAIAQGIDERTLAAELANYALGLTVEKTRARSTDRDAAKDEAHGAEAAAP